MKRRILSLILALALMIGLVSVCAPRVEAVRVETEELIAPQYEDVTDFSEGYAAVKKDGKWALINEKGEAVTEFKYDWIGMFSEGVALAANLEELDFGYYTDTAFVMHLIDGEGGDILLEEENNWDNSIPEGYEFYPKMVWSLDEGGEWYAIDGVIDLNGTPYTTDGELIRFDSYDELAKPHDGTYGYIFDYVSVMGPCVDGIIPMRAGVMGLADGYSQCFWMDTEGNIVKQFDPCCWDDGTGLSLVFAPDNGLVVASELCGVDEENWGYCYYRYGVMDMDGNWIAEPAYTNYYAYLNGTFFSDGLMSVCNEDGLWGAINTEGETVIDFQYDWLSVFSQGLATARDAEGKCCYVDAEGKTYEIAALDGGESNIAVASTFNSEGLAAVYDATTGKAYCVSMYAENGVLPVVENTEDLGAEIYFPDFDGEGVPGHINPPTEIIAVQNEEGLWGYRKLDLKGLNPFTDVPDGQWYTDPIIWAVDEGITTGTTETTFAPNSECTRAHIVTFLWRSQGSPEPTSSENPFTDVVEGEHTSWYYKAVLWAVEKGITNGTSDTTFDPGKFCTRAEVATFLWRTAGKPESETAESPFGDVAEGAYSSWYYNAVLWAVDEEITNGVGDGLFAPGLDCTRAQIVTFLYRYMN